MRIALGIATLLVTAHLAAADNHCEITVTGDSSASIKADMPVAAAKGKLAAVTDYWLSDSELRTGVGVFVGLDGKLSKADKERKIDEQMRKDPRFMLFILNCLTDDGGAIFSASGPSKYGDFPFKPSSHAIVGGAGKPGDVTVMFHISPGGKRERFSVKEPGKLVLTQFDKKGIAGTFSFKAESGGKTPKRVDVSGKFSYACSGGACEK